MSDEQTPFGAPGDVPADSPADESTADAAEAADEATADAEVVEDSTVEEQLIEAGDALVAALAGGNTGVSQNALDGWEAAKSAALAAKVEGEFAFDAPPEYL